MSNDNNLYIKSFQFEICHLSEKSHHLIEERFVKIFDYQLRRITRNSLTKYNEPSDVLIDKIELDLGQLYQEDLEQQLPIAFEKALETQLLSYLKKNNQTLNQTEANSNYSSDLSPLFHYLHYGFFPWYFTHKINFLKLWNQHIEHKKFVLEADSYHWKANEIERLSLLLIPPYWKKTLQAFVPSQTSFIVTYKQEILHFHEEHKDLQTISKFQLNFLLKKFILTYIFLTKGSFFSKKQFLMYQLKQMASHYHMGFTTVLNLFINQIASIQKKSVLHQELYMLLYSIGEDSSRPVIQETLTDNPIQLIDLERYFNDEQDITSNDIHQVKRSLFSNLLRTEIKLKWLSPLQEEKLYRLLEENIGEIHTRQIKTYHQQLYKNKDIHNENVQESNFKKAVWEFTIDYFAHSFSSYFQLKTFIIYHTKALCSRYNLHYNQFLNTLIYVAKKFFQNGTSCIELFMVLHELSHSTVFIQKPRDNDNLLWVMEQLVVLVNQNSSITSEELEQYIFNLTKNHNHNISYLEIIHWLLEQLERYIPIEASIKNVLKKELQFLLVKISPHITLSLTHTNQLVIISERTEPDLRLLQTDVLSIAIFKKVLMHEPYLSNSIVRNIYKLLQQKKVQDLVLKNWIWNITSTQQLNFIKLLVPQNYLFFTEVWKLINSEFSYHQNKKLYIYFFKELVFKGFTGSITTFWSTHLLKMSQLLNLSSSELSHRLLVISHKRATSSYVYNTQYSNLLKLSKTYSNSLPRIEAIQILNDIFSKENLFTPDKVSWKEIIAYLKKTNELPHETLWNINLFFESYEIVFPKISKYFPQQVKYLLHSISQRYKLIHIRKKLKTIYQISSIEIFLLTVGEFKAIKKQSFNFSSLSKQELRQWTHLLLTQNSYFEIWLHYPVSLKIQIFEIAYFQKNSILIRFYLNLEKLYAGLQDYRRPYCFRIFEAHFWNIFLSSIQRNETTDWAIITNWIYSMNLKNPDKFFSKIEEAKITIGHQKEWVQWKVIQHQKAHNPNNKTMATNELTDVILSEKIEMPNTGLVILHPYLKQLFTRLEYILPSGEFKSNTNVERAITLLHYIATGTTIDDYREIEESQFLFPKILCGFPITNVLVPVALSENEINTATGLLKACLNHWDKLKNSSINTLRNSFLQRKGIVVLVDNAYQLTVEKSAIDILLNSLPWSLNIVRLPWLKETIFTTWQ